MRFAAYGMMTLLLLLNLEMLRLGGHWLWLGFFAAAFMGTFVDEAAGLDLSAPSRDAPTRLLNFFLYATLPLVVLNSMGLAALIAPDEPSYLPALGFGTTQARAATSTLDIVGGILSLGLFLGAAGVNVAHELVHRTSSALAMNVGRCLLAFTFDTTFAIEHVYGHHRNVGTKDDPATARRGEYVLAFFWRVLRDGNMSAWNIEKTRLERKGLSVFSWSNRVLSWQLASVLVLLIWWQVAGWVGVLCALAAGIVGKFFLEAVDYIEHYGLVRVPGTALGARHSWNCHLNVTNKLLYNLARHSHHHAFAGKPFWELEADESAPQLPHGYMIMILASLVLPVWNAMMNPRLAAWDENLATPEERALAALRI